MSTKTLTAEEVAARFKQDLAALFEKWGAEMETQDHYQGYPECGEDIRMTVTVPAVYNDQGDTVRERVEIDLGKYFPR